MVEADAVFDQLAVGQRHGRRELDNLPRRHGLGGYGGNPLAQEQHEQNQKIQPETDADQKIGSGFSVQLTDQVRAQEGERVGEHAHRQRHGPELDKSGNADHVEQGHGAQKNPREHEKHPFASLLQQGRAHQFSR